MDLSLGSSSSSRTCLYDVFPSFSGEDVRITFLSHFLKELDRKLIISFKDNEIQRSRSLDPELKLAIKDSRIAVVIFSENYASSSWCLNELLEIVKSREECGQMVIPVFYRLDPSHVRKQTGDFGKNFEQTCHNETEEVKIQWRRALTDVANITGFHSVSNSIDIFSRANSGDYNMKLHLQSRFLSKILGRKDIEISQLGELAERLKHHRLLICIDDLDDQVVLDSLVGQTQRFGSGSRIILVTNDKHFLRAHGIDHIYEVCLPSQKLAVEMFCRSAFRKKSPPEGFEELVVKMAILAGRLPLGLSVLGSSLRGRDKEYWVDLLPTLQTGIDEKIERTLKFSYDGLSSDEDKRIFRYIACLFNGEKVAYMKLLLADSGLGVNVGMENLADKSLIHISSWGSVKMHRLLQEMGKKVNRLEKPKNREFLEDSQDICDVLSKGIGTEKVLSISLGTGEVDELYLHENAFRGMCNLRFLKIYSSCRFDTKNLHIPKLKILDWYEYPMRCLPSKFRPENLVKLKMQNSKLENLWKGVVALPCLKVMDLRKSYDLIEMPDLSKATNLETLNLWDCYSLVKFPSSIPHPNKLKELNMMNCRNLETIPIGIILKSLEVLNLCGCSRLRTFPQISTNILNLSVDGTGIEEFPSNLHLKKLSYLNMQNLKSKKLWERVQPLTLLTAMLSPSLESLRLSDIPTLVELPCSFQNLHQLENLKITNCVNLESLPTGINLQSLRDLDLSGCSRLRNFPDISTSIERLYLSETGIEEVPCWIEKFTRLEVLSMNGCNKLKFVSLNISKLKCLEIVDLSDCLNLDQEALKTYSDCLLRLSGEEVPSYFTHRTTVTSSSSFSLTAPLRPSSLSQPFLGFRACIVHTWDNMTKIDAKPSLTGRFWNSSDSYDQEQDFRAEWFMSERVMDSHMLILGYRIPLSRYSNILAQMNYTHIDLQLDIKNHSPSEYKEWGIRLLEDCCSSADNPLGNPNILPHVFEADEGSMLIEAGECGGNDVVTEPNSKRMRIS